MTFEDRKTIRYLLAKVAGGFNYQVPFFDKHYTHDG
jgi:hypothetical protein